MSMTIDCDLRHLFGPARDQGPRQTCMAFAASDTHAAILPYWDRFPVNTSITMPCNMTIVRQVMERQYRMLTAIAQDGSRTRRTVPTSAPCRVT